MAQPILEFRRVSKAFHGATALRGVSFLVQASSVIGFVGENGAGKSTLMNILAGNLRADEGELLLDGNRFRPSGVRAATESGIALVHQELNLFPNLSIAENFFLSGFPRGPLGFVNRHELRRRAQEALRAVHLSRDPETLVETLSPGERQLVEIAKALIARPRILVLDEPTTSLSRHEAERLFNIVERLRSEGAAIIYVSHNLGDVLRLSDDIVVLRDGEVQTAEPKEAFTIERLVHLMVGRELAALFPARGNRQAEEVVLEVRGLSQPGVLRDISFSIHRGELLGLTGLMGAGRTELARMLFGLDPFDEGEIRVNGGVVAHPRPGRCVQHGMGFLTEDRHTEGLLLESGAEDNLALASWPRFARGPLGWVRSKAVHEAARGVATALALHCSDLRAQPTLTLSGGNQQKVVLGKWLLAGSDVLILDEPTRGVDVAARHDLYSEINRLLEKGAGVLMISSELEELMGMCDRILVMARGEIRGEYRREAFDQRELLRTALGEERLQ